MTVPSFDAVSDYPSDSDYPAYLRWKAERDERARKSGDYWLTPEGREEIRSLWTDASDGNVPAPLLSHIEALEAESAKLAQERDEARAEAGRLRQENDYLWGEIEHLGEVLTPEQVSAELARKGIDMGPAKERVRQAIAVRRAAGSGRSQP